VVTDSRTLAALARLSASSNTGEAAARVDVDIVSRALSDAARREHVLQGEIDRLKAGLARFGLRGIIR
jgi:hypothetical protein